jgi:phage protein D
MMDVSGPIVRITVLDQAGNEELLQPSDVVIESMKYTDSEKSADKLALSVDNFDLRNFDNPIWKQGNRIRAAWGYPGRMAVERECVIRKVTGFQKLSVEAHGMAVVMNRVRRSRTFENMSRIDIVKQIARENGYDDDSIDIESGSGVRVGRSIASDILRGEYAARRRIENYRALYDAGGISAEAFAAQVTYLQNILTRMTVLRAHHQRATPRPSGDTVLPHVVQANMTDAQFLRRLANLEGCEFFVDFDGFHFHPRRLDQSPTKTFTYYTNQEQPDVLEINITNDVTALPGRTRVRRRDPITRQETEATADNSTDTNRPTTGDVLEVIDPDTGFETLRLLTAQEETTQGGSPATSPETAQQDARARFRRAQQRAVQMTLKAIGDPFIFAKSIVRVDGIGQRLSGNYYIKEVTHELDSNGYTMGLSLIKDATGSYARQARRTGGLPDVAGSRANGQTSNQQQDENEQATNQANSGGDSTPLVPMERIDPDTGAETVVYVREQGRTSRSSSGVVSSPASTTAAQAGRDKT